MITGLVALFPFDSLYFPPDYLYLPPSTSPSNQYRGRPLEVNRETTLHSQEHPKRFIELYTEEKWKEGDRDNQEENRESQKGRGQPSQ